MKRIAIIGYGYWGPNLLRNFYETPNCEVLYCCDKDITKLKKARSRYPSLIPTTNYEEVLGDTELDAVVIATPNKTHYQLAKEALEANKDVLIEKPMTLSVKDAIDLVTLAKKKKRLIMVDHVFLFTQAVRKLKEIVDSEELGDIVYIDSVRINLGLFQEDSNVIFDLATHDISILQYLLEKEPTLVNSVTQSRYSRQEEIGYIHLEYPEGVTCHLHVSWLSPLKVRRLMVVGTKKMVVYDDVEVSEKIKVYDKGVMVDEQLRIGYRSGDINLPNLTITEALSVMAKEFIEGIISRKAGYSDGQFGASIVNILEKATISARQKKPVNLSQNARKGR